MIRAPRSPWIVIALFAVLSFAGLLRATLPQSTIGAWTATSSLSQSRSSASSVMLTDGRILITGGDSSNGALQSSELFGTDGTISSAAAMNVARSRHFAVILSDGRVLVGGGLTSGGGITNTAEVYDPSSNTWTQTSPLTQARANATAAVLPDGRVVIAGGDNSGTPNNTIEIYDPSSGNFSFAGTLSSSRTKHAMAVLKDGRVLVVGGFDGTNPLASSEIFDPSSESITTGPALAAARYAASATTLLNGQVAIIGGAASDGNGSPTDLASIEIFDPAAGAFSTASASLAAARQGHQAFLLPNNNNVLITGGTAADTALASSELFAAQASPSNGAWSYSVSPAGAMTTARASAFGSANQLNGPTSSVVPKPGLLIVGGGTHGSGTALNSTEVYGYATVQTDQGDYPPGTTVNISGSGFTPGETVSISLLELPLFDTHGPYTVVADGNGNISDSSFVTDTHDLNIRFFLSAVGSQSGVVAQNTFTDANPQTLTLGTQSPRPILAGSSSSYSITLDFNGNSSPCTVDLTGAISAPPTWPAPPVGGFFTFGSNSLTSSGGNPPPQSTTLTVRTPAGMAANTYNFTVTATPRTTCQNNSPTLSANGTMVVAGSATHLSVTGFPSSTTAGTPGNFTVTALDTNNNVAIGYTGTLTFSSTDPQATFSPASYTFVAADNGTHTFTNGATLKTAGFQSISASATGVTAGSQTGITVNAGTAASMAATAGTPQSAAIGTAFTIALQAMLKDSNNNPVSGAAVTFTAPTSGASGKFANNTNVTSATTDSSGIATASILTANATTGSYNVTASTNGVASAVSFSLTNVAGAATKFVVSAPTSATAGTPFSVTVTAQDSGSNTAIGYTGTVKFTLGGTDAGATVPANYTFVAGDNGVHTFTNGFTLTRGGTQTITSTDTVTASINGTSGNINVSSGTPNKLAFGQQPSNSLAGSPITPAVTVLIQDQFGNPTTSAATVALALNPAGGNLTGTTSITAFGGTVTFSSLTVDKAGAYTLSAGSSGLTGATSNSFSVDTKIVFTSVPVTEAVGGCSPQVTIQRQNNSGGAASIASSETVALSANIAGTSFFSDASCSNALSGSNLSIGANQSSASFFFKNTSAAAPPFSIILTATKNTFVSTSSTQTESVVPNIAFSNGPSAATVGFCSATAAKIVATDGAGTAIAPSAPLTVTLASSSANGTFYSDNLCSALITTIQIPSGNKSGAMPFYKDNSAGTPTLTATAGPASDTFQATINKATAVFSNLIGPTISVGDSPTTFSGTINKSGAVAATGSVNITLAGTPGPISQSTTLDSNGNFSASIPAGTIPAGTYTIQYTYLGDSNFNSPSPNPNLSKSLTVNNPVPTLTSINPSSGNVGQSNLNVALKGTNFVTGVTSVSFGSDIPVNSITVNSPTSITASISIPANATVGAHNVSVTNAAPGGGTATLTSAFTVNNPRTSTSVSSSLNSSGFGQSVIFTATVTSPAGAPTGGVIFYDGACGVNALGGAVPLNVSGVASFSTSALNTGTHTITACYTHTGVFLDSNGSVTQQVTQATPTVSFTGASASAEFASQFVVSATTNASTTATISASGACTINGTTVTMTSGIGTCSLQANWAAETNYIAAQANQLTNALPAPVSVAVPDTTVTYDGSPKSVTPTVTPADAFTETYAGISPTVYPTSVNSPTEPGSYTVSVSVTGPNYSGNGSGTLTINEKDPTLALALLSGMPDTTPYGTRVYFELTTATSPCPTGQVDFFIDSASTSSETTTLSDSPTCTYQPIEFSTATLEPGTHNITAVYSGDAHYLNQTSAVLSHTVLADTTTVTLATSAMKVSVGDSVTLTATVTPDKSLDPAAATPTGSVQFYDNATTLLDEQPVVATGSKFIATSILNSLPDGPHSITATYVSANGDFAGNSSPVQLETVAKITPTIHWQNPGDIDYGTKLSETQLNATATDDHNGGAPITGTLTYTPDFGTVLAAGQRNLMVSFAPDDVSKYTTQSATATVNVTPATLTVTADNQSRDYGAENPTFTLQYSGFVNSENSQVVTIVPTCTTTATSNSPIGSYAITCSGAAAANYTFMYVDGKLTINPAPLTITASDATKTYGQTLTFAGTEFSTRGLAFNTDTITSVTLTSAGASATASVVGSPYTITPSAAVGTGLGNYTITYKDGKLTVDPAALNITAKDASKNYGQSVSFGGTEFTVSGLLNSDTLASVTLTSAGAATTATVTAPGPAYPIVPSAAVGTGLGNYKVYYKNGTLTVNAAPLTITAKDASKNYGQSVSFGGTEFTVSGLLNSDTLASVTLTSAGAATTATVTAPGPTYPIVPSAAVGTGLGNYKVYYKNGTLTVNSAPLTITAKDASKNYGQSVSFGGTEFTVSGLLNSDTLASVTLTSAGAATTATVTAPGPTYPIVPSAAVGTGLGNYTIDYKNGKLTVNRAPLTVTASDATPTYTGLPFSSPMVKYYGFVNGESSAALGGTLTFTYAGISPTVYPAGDAPTNAGSYSITPSGLTADNYDLTFVAGTLTINKAKVFVMFGNIGPFTYNGNPQAPAFVVNGVNNEVLTSSGTASYGGTQFDTTAYSNVNPPSHGGTFTQTVAFGGNANYNPLSPSSTQVFIINKANQAITFAALVNKMYGDPDFAVTATSDSGQAVSFAIGTTDNCTISGSTAHITGAGSCTITASQHGNNDYNPAIAVARGFSIAKADVSVVFSNIGPFIYNRSKQGPSYAINGVNNEVLTSLGTASYSGTQSDSTGYSNVSAPSHAGSYTETIAFAGNNNYNVLDPSATQFFTIYKANQTIMFGALASKTYGDPDFTVSATSSSGLAVSFAASGNCTVLGALAHIVGAGSCTVAGSQAGDNDYNAASPVPQTFSIGAVALTVTAANKTKLLNAANPALTASYSGFVLSEGPANLNGTLTCSTTALTNSPIGSYPITCSGQTSPNYSINYAPGTLKIIYMSGGMCAGDVGHAIRQPINADQSSVFKLGSTVPTKFAVCDANGNSIGTAGVISGYGLVAVANSAAVTVDETVYSTTPDSAFRFDPTGMQWIFNQSTKNNGSLNKSGVLYYFVINLNDGTSISFAYALK